MKDLPQKSMPRICPVCEHQYSEEITACPLDNCELLEVARNPLLGVKIDSRYEVKSLIATGGWSSVYLGQDLSLNRPVAIKLLHTSLAGNAEDIKRFKQEAVAISALTQPNIITIFDCGYLPDGQPYMITEYIKGETLGSLIKFRGTLSAQRTLKIMMQSW